MGHVPNLVESRILKSGSGERGDGSFRCKLFQRGAQKIVGFEFGASLTMEMAEKTIMDENSSRTTKDRVITFKCVDSQFFSEFDGEWIAKSSSDGLSTMLNYIVDIKPKGPVPVVALEWRIREDVPTNLRAVKKAAMETGLAGVVKMRKQTSFQKSIAQNMKTIGDTASVGSQRARQFVGRVVANTNPQPRLVPVRVNSGWEEDETMAVYLNDNKSMT